MFYAHEGNRTDNAFPTYNGAPTRTFRAFNTKKERDSYRDKVWDGGQNNLIDCKRKFVEQYLTVKFTTHRTGDGDSYICAHPSSCYQIGEAEFDC